MQRNDIIIIITWSQYSHSSLLKMIDFNAKTQGLFLHKLVLLSSLCPIIEDVGFYLFVPIKMQKIVDCWWLSGT